MTAHALKRRLNQLERIATPSESMNLTIEFLDIAPDGRFVRQADGALFDVSAEGSPIRPPGDAGAEGEPRGITVVFVGTGENDRLHKERIERAKQLAAG